MPRPKGSKNKSTLEKQAAPQEFDYERDDIMFDNSYRETGAQPQTDIVSMSPQEAFVISDVDPTYAPETIVQSILYLVEGEVQLMSREPGRGSVVAKQFRLVEAKNETEAVGKYSNYFASLSDSSSVYSVQRAAAMAVIR